MQVLCPSRALVVGFCRMLFCVLCACSFCCSLLCSCFFFFFQAEDGIRDLIVTGVQTCALPIFVAEIGSAMTVGGNIRGQTRTLTTAVALYTSQGDFGLALALGLILLLLALLVNVALQTLQGRGHA